MAAVRSVAAPVNRLLPLFLCLSLDGDWRENDRVSVGRELFVFSPAAATAVATKAGECAREAGSDQFH